MRILKTIKTKHKTIKLFEWSKPNSEIVKYDGKVCFMKVYNN